MLPLRRLDEKDAISVGGTVSENTERFFVLYTYLVANVFVALT